jgi:hypothetical protein
MRDMRADWRRWTQGERIAAITLAAAVILAAPMVAALMGA